MSENDVERRLEKLLGEAAVVAAPDRLREAVREDRRKIATSGAGRLAGRGRLLRPAAAIAATIVLAAGALVAFGGRLSAPTGPAASSRASVVAAATTPATAPTTVPTTSAPPRPTSEAPVAGKPITAFDWHEGAETPNGPLFAFDGKLWSFADGVQTSSDGVNWTVLAGPSVFRSPGTTKFAPEAVGSDGRGGLLAFGCSTVPASSCVVDGGQNWVWHSPDGRTWTRRAFPSTVEAVGTLGTTIVATGPYGGLWYSTDGDSWAAASVAGIVEAMPGSLRNKNLDTVFVRDPIAWGGRFYALGYPGRASDDPSCTGCVPGTSWEYYVGMPLILSSADGRAWQLVSTVDATGSPARGFARLAAFGDRLVVLTVRDASPAAWVSTDGRTWTESALPRSAGAIGGQPDLWPVAVFAGAVRGNLVFVADDPEHNISTIWASPDGRMWTIVGTAPWNGMSAGVASLDDRLYAVPSGPMSSALWIGEAR